MKYKVIGWDEANYTYAWAPISKNVRNAVIREIREKNLHFSGDTHEYYCPILNDGTIASWSWRGWGDVMAEAWDEHAANDKYSYTLYYMDMGRDGRILPNDSDYKNCVIQPRDEIADTHIWHMSEKDFAAAQAGTLDMIAMPYDEFCKMIDIGDYLELHCGENKLTVLIEDIYTVSNPESLTDNIYAPSHFGVQSSEELVAAIKAKYTAEQLAEIKYYSGIKFVLPADLANGEKHTVNFWCEELQLTLKTNRLNPQSNACFFTNEQQAMMSFLDNAPFNDPEIAGQITLDLIDRAQKCDIELTVCETLPHYHPKTVELYQYYGRDDFFVVRGTDDITHEGFCIVFQNGDYVGVGDDYDATDYHSFVFLCDKFGFNPN